MSKLVISHSEVDSYLGCERSHYYAFGMKLQPIKYSMSLQRGIMGHELLEAYYSYLQASNDPNQARAVALNKFEQFLQVPGIDLGLLASLQELINKYFDYAPYLDSEYKILHVEEVFRLPISDNIEYPYKPDLIVKHIPTGRIHVIDHKFVYNFYTVDDMKIAPQLAKYMGALRAQGINVHSGIYNMIRWRPIKDNAPEKIFVRESVPISNARVATTFREQVATMEQIGALKALPLDEWEKRILRSASAYKCKNCSFSELCTLELDGQSIVTAVKYNYEPNTYGYSEEVEGA